MAGGPAVGNGRHVGGVGFQEHAVFGNDFCGFAHAGGVLERDDAREAYEYVRIEGEEALGEFSGSGKAVDVYVFSAQVGRAQDGERVVVCFAQVQYERFAAFYPEL